LRYLARSNVTIAVELLSCSSLTISSHLLLQSDGQLSIGPPTLCISSLIGSCCCHRLRWSLSGGSMSHLSHGLMLNIGAAHSIINDLLSKHRSIFFSLHYEIFAVSP
jgi:hypothetical protein